MHLLLLVSSIHGNIHTIMSSKKKKKRGFLKVNLALYLPSRILEWGGCVEVTDILHLHNYLAWQTGCPVETWQNAN